MKGKEKAEPKANPEVLLRLSCGSQCRHFPVNF